MFQEDPLEEKMAAHASILAWKIEEPGGLQPMGLKRVKVLDTRLGTCVWACMQNDDNRLLFIDPFL